MQLPPLPQRVAVVFLVFRAFAVHADERIDEIVVTADFRERTAAELPTSVSILDAEQVNGLAVQHFEELVGVVPNLNFSGDGHRARYFQVRGVGELEQYQGAPNPSIGFLIDDIDFSGIGGVATLFDVERVEVLRGPQGTRYGANALGGLIYVRSVAPAAERNGRLTASAASDNAWSLGLAFGGSIDAGERSLFRISAHHHESDGFRDNTHLGRTDSNQRDETTLRGRLRVDATDTLEINLAAMYTNIDNGYDVFALDSGFTMLSNDLGQDVQESVGASLRLDWALAPGATLTSITAYADSDIAFGFDADWGNDDSWAPFVYEFTSASERRRKTLSQEFRLVSNRAEPVAWLVGVYALHLDEDFASLNAGILDDRVFAPFVVFDPLASQYEATSLALFGQVDGRIGARTRLSAGVRLERRDSEYGDTSPFAAAPTDEMIGGELSISHDLSDAATAYAGVSRGFKAGGFNLGLVPDELRSFDQEALWNIETGIKTSLAGGAVNLNVSAFYSRRIDQQVRLSFQLNPNDPASFGFATVNADGDAAGLEADVDWQVNDAWRLYAALGLIDTQIERIELPGFLFEARDNAHAPRYTIAAGAEYRGASGLFARVDASLKDEFYFDVSHNQVSQAYELINARLGFDASSWTLTLWARNLFDERYAVRGFFFGNEPPGFAPSLYTRPGDPRQVGVTFDKRFD